MQLRAPLDEMFVTWGFGEASDDPRLEGIVHAGTDLRAGIGTAVYAAADGDASPGNQYDQGFGRYMRLDLGHVRLYDHNGQWVEGELAVYYAHLSVCTTARRVRRGEVIGWTGNTGFVIAAHLHWEVRVSGTPVDPMRFVEGAVDAQQQLIVAMGEVSKEVRWTLEAKVVREIQAAKEKRFEAERLRNQAAALDAEADEQVRAVYELLGQMVSPVNGIAYRGEIMGGNPAPPVWEG